MKKILAIVLTLVLCLSLAACGNKDDGNTDGDGDGNASGIKVAYMAKNTVDAFHATINNAAKAQLDAYKADGTIEDWQLFDGQTDPSVQVNLIEDAINAGFNFVIFLPAEAAGSAPVVSRCAEENIPIVVVNSKTDNTDELATAYVGSNDVEAGEIMAQYVIDQVPEGGKYAHMMGIVGNSAQMQRGEGIANLLEGNENWEKIDDYAADWSADKAVQFATDVITQHGDDVKAIICDNDDMSSAVQAYCNSIGREDIVCIGVDGNAGPLQMVKNEELGATVFQEGAKQVEEGIKLIPKIAAGESFQKETMIPFTLVTIDNVDNYLA